MALTNETKQFATTLLAVTGLTLILAASAIGAREKAAVIRADDAPAHIEKDVIDLSKYVFLHQTRDVGVLSAATSDSATCGTKPSRPI